MISNITAILESIVSTIEIDVKGKEKIAEAAISNILMMAYEDLFNLEIKGQHEDMIDLLSKLKDLSSEWGCRSGLYFLLSDLQSFLMR